jgi:hypothetical protein
VITCKNCGNDWREDDNTKMYYFSSATQPIGSYTAPILIYGAAEQMLTCPACPDKHLERCTTVLNDDKPGTGNPMGRYDDEGDRERASQGKANVVQRPIL